MTAEKKDSQLSRREFLKTSAAAGAFAILAGATPAVVWADERKKFSLTALPELVRPHDVAVAPDGTVYVANAGRYGVVRLAGAETGYLGKGPGPEPGYFNFPMGVDVAADGSVFVADTNNGRVQIFSGEGEFKRAFGRMGYLDGEFLRPKSVCAYRDGVLVADTRNHRVQYIDLLAERVGSGEPVTRAILGGLGEGPADLKLPRYVTADARGLIYVADTGHRVVKVFAPDGRLVAALGAGELQEPTGIAVAADGRVFVADAAASAVVAYQDYKGKRLGTVNGFGRIVKPAGIAWDDGYLLVADPETGKVFATVV